MILTSAMIAARFVHFAAIMALFGLLLFPVYTPPPAADALRARLGPAYAGLAAAALLSAMVWVLTIIAAIADPGARSFASTIREMFLHTGFGRVFLAIFALDALVFMVLISAPRTQKSALWLTGLSLALLSATGHGAIGEGLAGLAARGARALHLLAGGVWLGGLFALLASLRALSLDEALRAVRGFARAGVVAVAIVFATGVVNTLVVTGRITPQLSTVYGRLLGLKIALAVALVFLAAFNRLFNSRPTRLGALLRTVRLEIAVFAAILFIVAVFATMSPR